LLLLLFLLFLIPVAVYCLVLAGINRRPQPVMVGGAWDVIGLLFAISGFLLGVLPGVVTLIYAKTLRQLPFAEPRSGVEAFGNLLLEWWGILLLYYVALTVGAVALVLHRRSRTVIYNVSPADWERAFAEVLARLGLEQVRSGKQITVATFVADDTSRGQSGMVESGMQERLHHRLALERSALLQVESFPALSNITLHWQNAPAELREQIEAELARALKEVQTVDNAAGAWFLGIGGTILAMVFLTVLVLVLLSFPRRF
jgi:hypothetical protein